MALPKPNLTIEQLRARQAQWVQNWRKKHPEKEKLARKRAYQNRKLRAIKTVGEAKCNNCGCDEIQFLEFNHINGNGSREYRESNRSSMMDRLLTGKRGFEDLEILCRVCNALDYLSRKNGEQAKRLTILWK